MASFATGAIITHTAAAAGVTGPDIDGDNYTGVLIFVDITALTGTTPTMTVTVEGKSASSGKYYTILASAALNAVGLTVLRIYPALTAAANLTANDIIPSTFRVSTTIAGTTPAVTAVISADLFQ